MSSYPHFNVHWKSGEGQLLSDYHFTTPITGHSVSTEFITLYTSGDLLLRSGYVWDFGSGPAIDTPDMVHASLAHDSLYELMLLGHLPWSLRKKVDKFFIKLLKSYGMCWARRQWVYLGVRYGYPVVKSAYDR